jgi:hypothetical protein
VTEQVDCVHLPPEVVQIVLNSPPGQLAGLHAMQEDDGLLLRHADI